MVAKLGLIAAVAVGVFALVPSAFADQVFHTSHAALHPLGDAPLKSGFVNDIHTNGAVSAAREEYHLNGAQPGTYQVQLLIYPSQSCAGVPSATVLTALFTTSAGGNGNASATFPAGPANVPPLEVGIVWQLLSNGVPVYATDCVPVAID
jgi:hypothetical protein